MRHGDDITRVRMLRAHATRLRKIADDLNDEANALERQLSGVDLLGGRDLVDAAVKILAGQSHGLHYRELVAHIETTTGKRIRGADPAATLLANLDRDPRIVSCRSRSGRYAVATT